MSKFRDWQNSRKEVSFEYFKEMYPNSASFLESQEFPIGQVFIYRDSTWIAEQDRGFISAYYTYIRDHYEGNENMEILEMRQYLYQYDRDE